MYTHPAFPYFESTCYCRTSAFVGRNMHTMQTMHTMHTPINYPLCTHVLRISRLNAIDFRQYAHSGNTRTRTRTQICTSNHSDLSTEQQYIRTEASAYVARCCCDSPECIIMLHSMRCVRFVFGPFVSFRPTNCPVMLGHDTNASTIAHRRRQ